MRKFDLFLTAATTAALIAAAAQAAPASPKPAADPSAKPSARAPTSATRPAPATPKRVAVSARPDGWEIEQSVPVQPSATPPAKLAAADP